jgi:hypothetical protein
MQLFERILQTSSHACKEEMVFYKVYGEIKDQWLVEIIDPYGINGLSHI